MFSCILNVNQNDNMKNIVDINFGNVLNVFSIKISLLLKHVNFGVAELWNF